MKRSVVFFLFFFSISILFAQQYNYKKAWGQIEEAKGEGNFKSLREQIHTLFKQAQKDHNSAQKIKSLMYLLAIDWETEDLIVRQDQDPIREVFASLRNQIDSSSGVEKSLLQYYLASSYKRYQSTSNASRRDQTILDTPSNDPRTWTDEQFNQAIHQLYQAILENRDLLKKEKMVDWETILEYTEDTELSPSLYDVVFPDIVEWYTMQGINTDSLYQELINFHKPDRNKSAYLRYCVEYISLKTNGDIEKKKGLLKKMIKENSKEPYISQVIYELVSMPNTKPKDARYWCLIALHQVPESKWNTACNNLLSSIEERTVRIDCNQFIYPNKDIPLNISHKNIGQDSLELMIYDITPEYKKGAIDTLDLYRKDGILYSTLQPKLVHSEKVKLKEFDDYDSHQTIYRLEALKEGVYSIKIRAAEGAKWAEEGFDETIVKVTRFIVLRRGIEEVQILNSYTGAAMADTELDVIQLKLRNISKQSITACRFEKKIKTDSLGIFTLTYSERERLNDLFYYTPTTDEIIAFNTYYNNYDYIYNDHSDINLNQDTLVNFFSDRAIYRPGQKFYFKGIVTTKSVSLRSEIVPNKKMTVYLYNVNSEVVDSLNLESNNYGSISGEFILPANGLTGRYSISNVSSDYRSRYNFRVEEYKRPKMGIDFNSLNKEYTLGNKVLIDGMVWAYAGGSVANSPVTYSVKRSNYSNIYLMKGVGYTSAQIKTIVHGELKTDHEGKFQIPFIALPDEANLSKQEGEYRAYSYLIEATVTDINGETSTSSKIVIIGDLPRSIKVTLPTSSKQSDFRSVKISSFNLSGVILPAEGMVKITQLKGPTRVILPHARVSANYMLYDQDQYIKYFPHLPWIDPTQEELKDELEKLVVSKPFNTALSDQVEFSKLDAGRYLVQTFSPCGKDTVKTQDIVEILDDNTLKSTNNVFFQMRLEKEQYHVGDTAVVRFITDVKVGYVNLHVERNKKLQSLQQLKINQKINSVSYIITPEDLKNGIYLSADFFCLNDCADTYLSIPIVEKDIRKSLNIETEIFRDKIEPGEKETWVLKITGDSSKQVSSELLAAMYDSSLDEFVKHSFHFSTYKPIPYSIYLIRHSFRAYNDLLRRTTANFNTLSKDYPPKHEKGFAMPRFNWFGFNPIDFIERRPMVGGVDGVAFSMVENDIAYKPQSKSTVIRGMSNINPSTIAQVPEEEPKEKGDLSQLSYRTNLQETAFFFPQLYTDTSNQVKLEFTTPEALTKWKLLLFAHTKDLHYGSASFSTQTQKKLMLIPNNPRFLRAGDTITLSAKINNLSTQQLVGKSQLFLSDPLTNKSLDSLFGNTNNIKEFTVDSSQNTLVKWVIQVPQNVSRISCKVVAKSGDFSDGEQTLLPILPNRMLVTETLPLSIREGELKTFKMDKLINSKDSIRGSSSLQNFNLTLELSANPTWLAIISLPYLREYPYECSEQLFSRLYGNALSSQIINSSPKIKQVFEAWNTQELTVSNLENNQEFKSILLEETPWLRNAESETEQMKRLSVFFDLNKMKQELEQAKTKLIKRQTAQGGFSWYPGGTEDTYITGHIVAGFAKLQRLLGDNQKEFFDTNINGVIEKSINYLDAEAIGRLDESKRRKEVITGLEFANYFYVRSFWLHEYPLPNRLRKYLDELHSDYKKQALIYDLQRQAQIATVLYRYSYIEDAQRIVHAIKERAVDSKEMGMYWKSNVSGWRWYQSPVETQTALIEAFSEIKPSEVESIESMKVWLLKNRQTNHWNTTKSTAEAVYALMYYGKSWLNAEKGLSVDVATQRVYPSNQPSKKEAAGYIKKTWLKEEIKPEMGLITIHKTSPGVAYGGLFWQYFEDMDAITEANNDIHMEKELFIKENSEKGDVLKKISSSNQIKVGDLVSIRLVIKTDREMNYIHIKDMRSSGFEPTNVLSEYKWQNGEGYYESTRDASTNFFFSHMRAGTYVFEYTVRANNEGHFSNGITTLQNMYAPEMSAHTKGIRIDIK